MMRAWTAFKVVALGVAAVASAQETGNHPDWPRWCGKVYQAGYPNYDPGGQTTEPPPRAGGPGLHVQFKSRFSIYLEGEATGEFVVNAETSSWYGNSWPNLTSGAAPRLWFNINLVSSNEILVESSVAPNTTGNVFSFSLEGLKPSLKPYEVVLFGAAEPGEPNITATAELWYLPQKTSGSVSRLDQLNGGIWFRNSKTGKAFVPILPYGFYASYDGFLRLPDRNERIKRYRDLGLTGMVPLTTVWDSRPAFEYMGEIGLKFMYDLRSYYKNLTAVRDQVTAIKDFDTLYAYWGSDEPDGWQDPFNATVLSRDLIRTIDPYHPVSVTLNCQDYYFGPYTAGADIVMEDVYPIGINSTFSKWGTACNATHGDCGCDNCDGRVQDVSSRLEDLKRYERWLGRWPKTKGHNAQSFHGENYWMRDPTVDEEVAMNALALNHDAKLFVSWLWPTSDDLANIHGEFAKVITASPVVELVVGERARAVAVPDREVLDVAYWVAGGKMLVCVVNGGYVAVDAAVDIEFPVEARPRALSQTLWGTTVWEVLGFKLHAGRLPPMSTSILLLDL